MTDAKGDQVQVTIKCFFAQRYNGVTVFSIVPRDPASEPFYLTLRDADVISIERVPEPLYVNAPEIIEPEIWDVVSDADSAPPTKHLWCYRGSATSYHWIAMFDCVVKKRTELPKRLTLLLRGGKVWPQVGDTFVVAPPDRWGRVVWPDQPLQIPRGPRRDA